MTHWQVQKFRRRTVVDRHGKLHPGWDGAALFIEAFEEEDRRFTWPYPAVGYKATYRDLNGFDRVLFMEVERRQFFAAGVVTGRTGISEGLPWGAGDMYECVITHAVRDGVPVPADLAFEVAHPADRYGGQNAPLAPLRAAAGEQIAKLIVARYRTERLLDEDDRLFDVEYDHEGETG